MTQVNPQGSIFDYSSTQGGFSDQQAQPYPPVSYPPPPLYQPPASGFNQTAPVMGQPQPGMTGGMAMDPQQAQLLQAIMAGDQQTIQRLQAQAMQNMPAETRCRMSAIPVADIQCPLCQAKVTTTVEERVGFRNYFVSCVLCFSFACCFIPCLWGALKDRIHHCPNCHGQIAIYTPPRAHRRRGRRGRRR